MGYCDSCPYRGLGYVEPQLIENSGVLFIGQNPGVEEVKDGYPFSVNGKCGEVLRKYLKVLDEKNITYSVTNAVKCHSPNNKIPSKKEGALCLDKLQADIEYCNPKLIVVLGKVALRSLTSITDSILKLNGHILKDFHIPVLVCVHPSYVLRQGKSEAVFEKGILPALSYFDKENEVEIIDRDDIDCTSEEVAFDIETSSLRPLKGKIKCFSVSNGEQAIFVRINE